MFAPPPVQFSRAEIQTRLAGEETSAECDESPDKVSERSGSLHRNESRSPTSPRKRRFFRKRDRLQVSPPIAVGSNSPPPERQISSGEIPSIVRPELEGVNALPAGFGEHPRPAPAPPKRAAPTPNANTPWIPRLPGTFPSLQEPIQEITNRNDTTPPIPPKSSRRPTLTNLGLDPTQPLEQLAVGTENLLHAATFRQEVNYDTTVSYEALHSDQHHTSTDASAASRKHTRSVASRTQVSTTDIELVGHDAVYLRQKPSLRMGPSTGKRPSARSARVQKSSVASRQTRNAASHGSFGLELSEDPRGRATDGSLKFGIARIPRQVQFQPGRQGNGAPTTFLIRSEPLQNKEFMPNEKTCQIRTREDVPHRQRFIDKDLPATPTSIVATPTEIYEYAKRSQPQELISGSRKPDTNGRSPLAQLSATDIKANNSGLVEEEAMSKRLSAIPEFTPGDGKSSLASGSTSPVATHIHLRGGSLVTVSPPELTPWQRSVYIQGPIKFPKPVIVPRKNSVASLEPFQEAVDQVYQDALNVPRRRSDDRVLDDVCDFFDDFGFEHVIFTGDILTPDEMDIDITETGDNHPERFSTPPVEVSPVEKSIAKNIIEGSSMTKQSPISNPPIRPVETDNSLRTHGPVSPDNRVGTQPRTSSQRRKDSMTLSEFDTGVNPLLQLPKEKMERSEAEQDTTIASRQPDDQGFECDDDVAELDASSAWVALAAVIPTKYDLSKAVSGRNPVTKVRRLVATATALL